jgi:hypothetical protein
MTKTTTTIPSTENEWFMLTPAGVLRAFGSAKPDSTALALQALLTEDRSLDKATWIKKTAISDHDLQTMLSACWVQSLRRPLQGPDAKLDDFLQHVIAALSAQRQAVLASESGFCLGRAGVDQDEADVLSAAAAAYSEFATRQSRRGWAGASGFVAFHLDPEFLLPSHSFVPFWVDDVSYWLVIMGEPLLNSPALVELLWGIKEAGTRFTQG